MSNCLSSVSLLLWQMSTIKERDPVAIFGPSRHPHPPQHIEFSVSSDFFSFQGLGGSAVSGLRWLAVCSSIVNGEQIGGSYHPALFSDVCVSWLHCNRRANWRLSLISTLLNCDHRWLSDSLEPSAESADAIVRSCHAAVPPLPRRK